MTTLTVVPENGTVEDVLAARYRAAFDKTKTGREQWIEGTLELAAVMLEGRKLLPNDQAFSRWIERYNLHKINKDQRSALLGFAKDPVVARALLEATTSFSWDMIWRERNHKRVRTAPTPRPAYPPSPKAPLSRRLRRIPDVMRESYDGGIPHYAPRDQTSTAPWLNRPPLKLRDLTPEQIDPDFKGTPLEFTTIYGHVPLHTKVEIEATKRQETLQEWLRTVAACDQASQTMLAAQAKVDPAAIAEWLRKYGKREKFEQWMTGILRAYEALQALKNVR